MAPPNKSKTKTRTAKMTTQTLLDFDLGESSSDSDFRIEDHDESDDDFSENSNGDYSGQDDDDDDEEDGSDSEDETDVSERANVPEKDKPVPLDGKDMLEIAKAGLKDKLPTHPICCACLGDRSDDTNEIVECDGCGVSVHEGCYGVSDSVSVSSTISSCSTEPWFCEACRAGIINPICELCPNRGGIFKETDVGKWVHLVCALYVPGVAFGEVDHLSSVTLFEMPYSKWGAKTCSLCEDARFARTGVCIGCDAGMCKTYFHVTCAQAAGLLSEAHSEEADHADPFYAHCKVHSDKTMIKHRKRNFNTLKLRMEQRKYIQVEQQNEKPTSEQLRIQRKLTKHQAKYKLNKSIKMEPWVPTQKMPRLLTTSATACRRLMLKAELMGIDTAALEFQESQMAALADVRKKWHIPPAFSVEFIGYYLDRISRSKELKSNLKIHMEKNAKLLAEQQTLRNEYDESLNANNEESALYTKLKDSITNMHKCIQALCPNKVLPSIENIGLPIVVANPQPSVPPARPMSVPTAAALKMGVGFPLPNRPGTKDDSGRILSTQRQNENDLVHECGICKRCNDQHMLAKCDTCHFYYHLGCLNPPLTRHPKKSKLYGWQCSECDKSDDSDVAVNLPKGPRKSRTRFSKDGTIVPVDPSLSGCSDISGTIKSDSSPPPKRQSFDKSPPAKRKSIDKDKDLNFSETNTNGILEPETPLKIVGQKKTAKKQKRNLSPKKEPLDINGKIVSAVDVKKLPDDEVKKSTDPQDSVCVPCIEIKQSPNHQVSSPIPTVGTETKPINSDCAKSHGTKSKTTKKPKKERIPLLVEDKYSCAANETKNSETPTECISNIKKEPTIADLTAPPVDEKIVPAINTGETDFTAHTHKQNRKKRKEKHKNKYNDTEKAPSKEHKRKRKKKSHDIECPGDYIPKIKIKLKTLPLPGEAAPEPHCVYVSADMVRPLDNSRPTSVETVDDSTMNADDVSQNGPTAANGLQANESGDVIMSAMPNAPAMIANPLAALPYMLAAAADVVAGPSVRGASTSSAGSSGRKVTKRSSSTLTSPALMTSQPSIVGGGALNCIPAATSTPNVPKVQQQLNCDQCHTPGTTQNLVKCDECQKHYHFTCLDPPLKKTPKRRGYSWHCADCDPTDVEMAT